MPPSSKPLPLACYVFEPWFLATLLGDCGNFGVEGLAGVDELPEVSVVA